MFTGTSTKILTMLPSITVNYLAPFNTMPITHRRVSLIIILFLLRIVSQIVSITSSINSYHVKLLENFSVQYVYVVVSFCMPYDCLFESPAQSWSLVLILNFLHNTSHLIVAFTNLHPMKLRIICIPAGNEFSCCLNYLNLSLGLRLSSLKCKSVYAEDSMFRPPVVIYRTVGLLSCCSCPKFSLP